MKEFSNEELAHLLSNKVKEIKEEKRQTQELNERLKENMSRLEDTASQLEETQEELKVQRDCLAEQVEKKTTELLEKEKLATIGELAARIAHDMRNPLNIIKNSVEILELGKEEENPKRKEQWKRLDRAIYRMTHQVDDVLDYIKISPIKKTKHKISSILKDAVDHVQTPSTVKIKLPQNDAVIPCDPDKLCIVFVNLIMNAVQALNKKPGRITIKISNSEKFVLVECIDSGPGIPRALLPKIFDPLFTTRQVGTGLGLPSCKNIIEQHGGIITVKSSAGKGTKFLIKLPKKTEWESIISENKKEILTNIIAESS